MSGKLEIIPMRITRFETLDGCTALMLNKKNGNLETVRLCILIKSAEQYTKSLHKKWKTILRIGTELEFELLLDLEFELIVYLHSPTEKEFLEMYDYMLENDELGDDCRDSDDEDKLPEHLRRTVKPKTERQPKFPLADLAPPSWKPTGTA